MKKVTQQDIAKRLGITRTTVARALNSSGYVEESLKRRILTVAREMGYKTNMMARSLARKEKWVIHCFLVSYNDEFSERVKAGLEAVEKEFSHYGFILNIYIHHPDNPEEQIQVLGDVLRKQTVDGLIISPMLTREAAVLIKKEKPDIPLASLNLKFDEMNCLFHVGSNPWEGGALAASLLEDLIGGKGKIAVLNAFNQFEALHMRYLGFMNEMEKNREIEIVSDTYVDRVEDSFDAALKILDDHPDLDGFYSNTEVLYLQKALEKVGNDQIKLIGNDLTAEIKRLIDNRKIAMTLNNRPYFQGYLSGKFMFNYFLKNKLPSQLETYVGFDVVNRVNVSVENTFMVLTGD